MGEDDHPGDPEALVETPGSELPDGKGRVTLADPEGNEFCVERGAAERASAGG
ncbi:hypothetical protein [Streptomyces oryzae]|uniref:hypothetical protein n=1 Tax=Streptomyces oryzae TaxID=1434886 RepID=UPI001FFE05A0|nr:hypothetical protein [Streptomyces oryzae]